MNPARRLHQVTRMLLLSLSLTGCASLFGSRAPLIEPPPVRQIDISKWARIADGTTVPLGPNFWLFIPTGYQVPHSGEIFLTIHFHGADWYAKEVHARRGATNPLLIMGGLEGSNAYKTPFLDPKRFGELLDDVAAQFRNTRAFGPPRVTDVEISSFSAGYGAVREILKNPEAVARIRTVILADSMYASFATPGGGEDRRPLPEHVASFVEFARLAAAGKKTFLTTHCQLVTKDYASTADTARYLVHQLGGELLTVTPGSCPAADPSLDYPLLYRYDTGGLHVWGYAGEDGTAHIAQARALVEYWKALEFRR